MNSDEGIAKDEIYGTTRLLSGSAIVTVGLFLSVIMQFAATILLSYTIGDEGIGFVSLTLRTISLLSTIVFLGVPPIVAKMVASEKLADLKQSILPSSILLTFPFAIAVSVLLIIFSNPLSLILGSVELQFLLIIQSITIPISLLGTFSASYLRGDLKFGFYSLTMVITPILNIALLLFLIDSLSYTIAIIASVISTSIGAISAVIIARPWKWSKPSVNLMKKILISSAPLLIVGFGGTLIDSIDAIVLGAVTLDIGLVGVYSNMYALSSYLRYLIEPLSLVLLPLVSGTIANSGANEPSSAIKAAFRIVLIVFCPIVLIFAILSEEVIFILLPPVFLSGALSLFLLSIAVPFLAMYYLFSRVLIASDKTYLLGGLLLVCAILDVLMTLILTFYFGVLGTTFSTVITFIIMGISATSYAKKQMNFSLDIQLRDIEFIFLIAISCYGIHYISILLVNELSWGYPLIPIFLVFMIALIIAWIIKPINRAERDVILNFVAKVPIIGSKHGIISKIITVFMKKEK